MSFISNKFKVPKKVWRLFGRKRLVIYIILGYVDLSIVDHQPFVGLLLILGYE